jgi:citrate synthase
VKIIILLMTLHGRKESVMSVSDPLQATAEPSTRGGLEGVVVAETRLSDVDGERGRLIIGGYDVESLAGHTSFEDLCGLLWDGTLPSPEQGAALRASLGEARCMAFEHVPLLTHALAAADGMDALRGSLACLVSMGDTREAAVLLTGAVATFAAAWARLRTGEPAVPPSATRSQADDYLHMVRGHDASAAEIEALQTYLVTVSDHGMNASTFAARVVASTQSDPVSAVVAAVGALKGPLHGGAPGPVLDMLDAIGSPERAADWIDRELAAGRRIMGMGHRIYRVRDPRAAVLESAVSRLEEAGVARGRLALARAVEREAETALRARYPQRALRANVEFYTAILLDAVGLPREMFTPTFAVGRVAGWCAHVAEQYRTGRLIRPTSRYVGPVPDASYER